MNAIDIIIIIPLIWFGFKGFRNRLIKEAGSLAALILGIWGAMKLSVYTEQYVDSYTSASAQYIPVIAFAVTFLAIIIGVFLISGLLDRFVNTINLDWLNKLGGVVFGALKIAFILSGIIFMFNRFNHDKQWVKTDYLNGSLLYGHVEKLVPAICPFIPQLSDMTADDDKNTKKTEE